MNKLIQQEAPDQIWIQVLEAGDADLPEPQVFSEADDWYAAVFNSYFLSSLKKDDQGSFQQESAVFSSLKPLLDEFFDDGSLSRLHRQLCENWLGLGEDLGAGTWFSVSWKDFHYEDISGRAVGFFYATEEEVFLHLGGGEPQVRTGLPLKKPVFACLIFRNDSGEYRLWQQSPQQSLWASELFPFQAGLDDAFHSREFFRLCKSFSEDVLVKEQKKSREDQVGFLSDSLSYTKENQEVSFGNFRQEVLKEPSLIDAFDEYKTAYEDRRQWNPPDKFAVSEQVQNQAGKFIRSVIKLDKNFHIYVHGNKERLEKGFDASKKLNYYTLWFDSET
jgi:hypothetical protein